MKQIPRKKWNEYIEKLSMIDETAGQKLKAYMTRKGLPETSEATEELIKYANALVMKYGEASAALACEMYDAISAAEGVNVPPAEPAPLPEYSETAKAINGTLKKSDNLDYISGAVERLVKQRGADTMLRNAKRDNAEWAWIPNGDTCAFCMTLASRGWQPASKAVLQGGHAEHIHANCDCTFAIRHDSSMNVAGYDPEKYREMYDNAEGRSSKDKINALRREIYAENRDKINAQKRTAYAINNPGNGPDFYVGENKKVLPEKYKDWIGENKMNEYLSQVESEEAKRYIKTDFRRSSFIGDGSTADIRKFEKETGLNCGRNGGDHSKKVEDLIRQINKVLLKKLPENDKIFLINMLSKLEAVK